MRVTYLKNKKFDLYLYAWHFIRQQLFTFDVTHEILTVSRNEENFILNIKIFLQYWK